MIVARVRTPIPLEGLEDLLDAAHRDVRAFSLPREAYQLAVAQLKLEHGTEAGALRGLYNRNFANHDATREDLADPSVPVFQTVPEREVDVHGRGYLQVHTRRAYEDAEAGLMGYWQTLLYGFPEAYEALYTGSPEAFAGALKAARYYTADEGAYARELRALLPTAG